MKISPHRVVLGAAGILCLSLAAPIHAQEKVRIETPGVKLQLLLNTTLAQFPGKQITAFIGEFEPGAKTPWHRHPATEMLFVHQAVNLSQTLGMRALVILIQDEGMPPALPLKKQ